jgi:nitrite reductase/ring-hydroxylating ferredoxin subunit
VPEYRILDASDLEPGTVRPVTVDGRTIAVGRSEDGELFAFDNMCAHQGGPLGQGWVDGDRLVCPLHGWSYNIADGSCTMIPSLKITKHPIREDAGAIVVHLPDPPSE